MTAHIAVQPDGRHACYRVTASGKGRAYEGCDHLTPRAAIRHSDTLDLAAATPRPAAQPEPAGVLTAPSLGEAGPLIGASQSPEAATKASASLAPRTGGTPSTGGGSHAVAGTLSLGLL